MKPWSTLPGLHHDREHLWCRNSSCECDPDEDCDHTRRYFFYTEEAWDGTDYPAPWLTSERVSR